MPLNPRAGSSFNDSLSKQKHMVYPSHSTSVSPMATPTSHTKQTMGYLLASTPVGKRPMLSPQLATHTPNRRLSNNNLAPSSAVCVQERGYVKKRGEVSSSPGIPQTPRRSGDNSKNNSLCEEAYQLVQFCNHCTFGLEHSSHRTSSKDPGYQTQQNDPHCFATRNESSCERSVKDRMVPQPDHDEADHPSYIFQDNGVGEDSHYPFITPPSDDRDIALSQLNGNSYQLQPGTPRELNITKCQLQSRTDVCKTCRSLDEAIRPVVYSWNGWWEVEHVLCMMNDESYMNYIECKSEEDITKILGKNSKRIRKSLNFAAAPSKHTSSDYLTPSSATASMSKPPRSDQRGVKRMYGHSWMRKFKAQRQSNTCTPDVKNPTCKSSSKEAESSGDPFSRSRVVDACRSLKLIVSIPFRKLITERQLKKYCGEGGKHIPTLWDY